MKKFKITTLEHLINPATTHIWEYDRLRSTNVIAINKSDIIFCENINLKSGDKLYISKYSSIPSSLFNKLKFDLVQVRKPELADYVIADEPKNWEYSSHLIWDTFDNVYQRLQAFIIKEPHVKKLEYLSKYKCVNTNCLLKYLDNKKDKPTPDVVESICNSLKQLNVDDNKLAVDLLKYYDFSNNKIDLAIALSNNYRKEIFQILKNNKYLNFILNDPKPYNHYLHDKIFALYPLSNMTLEDREKVIEYLFSKNDSHYVYIKQSDYDVRKHLILYGLNSESSLYKLGLYFVYIK